MLQEPVKRKKRSVERDITRLYTPLEILFMCMRAHQREFILDSDRLEQSALVATLYLLGLRINEALSLLKSQFKRRVSLEKREFIVVEAVIIEKTGGKMRNSAMWPQNPIARPLMAHLSELPEDSKLFDLTDRTGLNIADRISDGVAWIHWFREQRNTFLASVFTKDERKKIFGWSGGQKGSRDMADKYEFLNWMSYADRLAKLEESYWENETIPDTIKTWLDSLPLPPTATTTVQNRV